MYSLERLANNHRELRQVVVNELCAYPRMPSPDLDTIEANRQQGEDEAKYWVDLDGATAKNNRSFAYEWPSGWRLAPVPSRPGWGEPVRVVPATDPSA